MRDGQSQHQQTGWCADERHPIREPGPRRVGVPSSALGSSGYPADQPGDSQLSRRREKAHLRLEQNGQPGKARISLVKHVRTVAVPTCALAYHSMVRATSLPVVALCPRVVHHCKLASKGTPLMPASISPIQWKPGTQMGRPLGGLRKAGFDPFEALGFAGNHRGIRPSAARLSGFSSTHLSRHPPEWAVPPPANA
jgi:hypothetical protein